MSAWISTKDRLPPEREDVLVWFGGQVKLAWLWVPDVDKPRWKFSWGMADLDAVTHWQPLPEGPEE